MHIVRKLKNVIMAVVLKKAKEKPKEPCEGKKRMMVANIGALQSETIEVGVCSAKLKCVECLKDELCEAGYFCSKQKCVPKITMWN